MLRAFKWGFRAIVALLVAGLLLGAGLYYVAARSLPDYNADYSVQGIDAPIEIVRDTNAVPHIFAKTDADVLFGLGFVHAQDRLWQMTLMRRTVQGRLSELFGRDTLEVDEFMRALDLYSLSQQAVSEQSPETITELEAYAAGVNAWIRIVNEQALGRGAPEFFLASNRIAPWLPADSIAMIKLMALQLSDQAEREVLRARLSLVLPPERLRDILPDDPLPAEMAVPMPKFSDLFPQAPRFAATPPPRNPFDPVPPLDLAGASNAWAAAGARSASGGTLLASDPHLPLTAPGFWYLARLEFSNGGAIGGTIPGIPGILVGRNADLGWGLTSSYLDDQDLVMEQLNPQNPLEYRTQSGFEPFRTKDILIDVKGEVSVPRQLRWSRNGPVIPSSQFNLSAVTPPNHVATLQWVALTSKDTSVEAALKLMRAHSITDAVAVAQKFVSPSNNITLADKDNIALVAAGRMPIRNAEHPTRGRMPSPGWIDAGTWEGFYDFSENPQVYNPESGIVVNTNNKIVERPFPRHFSYDWGDTQRIQRATNLLNARQYHTLTSFIDIQTDTVSITARTLLPLIARDIWWTGAPAPANTPEAKRQHVLELLANWNGEMGLHDPEPLIYMAWTRALQRRLTVDELGNMADEFTRINPVFLERVFRNTDGAAEWCDIRQTTPVETCREISSLALDDALLWLEETYGPNVGRWRWGAAHQAVHQSSLLGRIPVLSWFANIHQETPGGDNTLLRGSTRGYGSAPFTNVHASGFRGVYDFGDPDSSVMIASTGESGHFLSRHYDDLSVLWRQGQYIPMSLDPARARGGAVGVTVLSPR